MSTPLSKRRKTSPSASTAVADSRKAQGGARPVTPSRASYQSPTKAYLSRSHPKILARSAEKRYRSGQPLNSVGLVTEQAAVVEPELPPTPTQLGLSPKPDAPRGLSHSSSPTNPRARGSRSLARRTEDASSQRLKFSNSAAKETDVEPQNSLHSQCEEEEEGSDGEVSQPASRSSVRVDSVAYESEGSNAMLMARNQLVGQLESLKADTARLEALLDVQANNAALSVHDLSLITRASATELTSPSTLSIHDPVALDVNPLAFLRAFAPADLRLTTSTKTARVLGRLHQAYIINIFAPTPWPGHIFNASFKVTCDVTARRVISLRDARIQPLNGPGMRELKSWMQSRFNNPLHKLDTGTLVWGLGMWWKEGIIRAQYFHHFTKAKFGKKADISIPYEAKQQIDASEVQALLPFVGKSFIELIPAEPYSNKASTNEARKYRQPRLLLKWDLEIDWAGEVHSDIGIAGETVSAKGQEGLKRGFEELLRRKGLGSAVIHIMSICNIRSPDDKTKT